MNILKRLLILFAILLGTGWAQPSLAAEPSAACQEALDYFDQFIEADDAPSDEYRSSLGNIRVARDWLLANDPPELFAPIHATLIELYNFMLNEMWGYAASPEAMASPITDIMNRNLDEMHESYAACPELERAMLALDDEATPAP